MITLNGIDDIKARVGQDLGVSEWHEVTQEEINAFADVTGDHQWIHVDPERARETPFGGTIAHGFYTVALTPMLMQQLYTVTNVAFALNYGLDRVRFPAPLPVGSRVRASAQISSVDEIAGGIQMKTTITLERDGGDKPVCVAEQLVRIYGG
ncbi:MAG TPA: MaoC family dehydratase [Conexibacter sp.]